MLSRTLSISRPVPFMSKRRVSDVSPSASTSTTPKPLRLPRLPVPPLRDTLDRYLQSLEPLLLEDESRGGPLASESMRIRVKMAEEFERGIGKTCQERLVEIDKRSPYNWLDDNFWLNKAYLECRAPLLINSNWWLAYKDDPSVPIRVRDRRDVKTDSDLRAGISGWQIRRAAWLLKRTLEFKERLESQELYPDTTRTGLWMRNTVPRMFNVCRIPGLGCDRLSTPQASSISKKKVMVMLHDWIYAVDVYDGRDTNVGHIELEKRIRGVVLDVEKRVASGERAVPIGVLTSDDRYIWAKNYKHLAESSHANRKTLDAIEDSVMALSLDPYTYETSDPYPSELKSHLHNIRGGFNAHNRWFDKGVTLIVENNARAGMMGEHSPVDALVPSIVADYSLAEHIECNAEWETVQPFDNDGEPSEPRGWERLDWVVDDHVMKECAEAEERARAIITDSDDDVLLFTDYGTDWIKNTALLSPDAYIQMAMQLAWYRTRGSFTATYETALTRLFLHGRTDTIRSLSADSRLFILAMRDPESSHDERLALLRKALKTHGRLTKAAATGKGIDRHLLGLRLVMEDGESSPLFEDSFFAKSQEWKLSTSGLSAGEYFRGTGFGSAYPDGYGINYLAGPDSIKFGIESKFSCKQTSAERFKAAILLTLYEMKGLIILGPSSSTIDHVLKSRL